MTDPFAFCTFQDCAFSVSFIFVRVERNSETILHRIISENTTVILNPTVFLNNTVILNSTIILNYLFYSNPRDHINLTTTV